MRNFLLPIWSLIGACGSEFVHYPISSWIQQKWQCSSLLSMFYIKYSWWSIISELEVISRTDIFTNLCNPWVYFRAVPPSLEEAVRHIEGLRQSFTFKFCRADPFNDSKVHHSKFLADPNNGCVNNHIQCVHIFSGCEYISEPNTEYAYFAVTTFVSPLCHLKSPAVLIYVTLASPSVSPSAKSGFTTTKTHIHPLYLVLDIKNQPFYRV